MSLCLQLSFCLPLFLSKLDALLLFFTSHVLWSCIVFFNRYKRCLSGPALNNTFSFYISNPPPYIHFINHNSAASSLAYMLLPIIQDFLLYVVVLQTYHFSLVKRLIILVQRSIRVLCSFLCLWECSFNWVFLLRKYLFLTSTFKINSIIILSAGIDIVYSDIYRVNVFRWQW